VEFLVQHFHPLFNYDYTKQMEEDLEKVSEVNWQSICEKCENLIKTLSKPVSKLVKPVYIIYSQDKQTQYELCFHQYGASLKRVLENGEVEYKKVHPKIKIDIEMAKSGKYVAEEIMEIQNDILGIHNGEEVVLKTGKYGPYVKYGEHTVSLKCLGKPNNTIAMEDVIPLIDPSAKIAEKTIADGSAPRAPPAPKNPNILKILNSDISIRKGKYGAYIYYMTADAKKPEFFPLGKYKSKFENTDENELLKWIGETYNICVAYKK